MPYLFLILNQKNVTSLINGINIKKNCTIAILVSIDSVSKGKVLGNNISQ